MTTLLFTLIAGLGALLAGFLGALTGLGGGFVIVPVLTLLLKVNIHYAIGASLVCVIATSSGAAAAFVKEGFTNIRIGMVLEVATVFGALCGAFIAGYLSPAVITVIFGLMLIQSAILSGKKHPEIPPEVVPDRASTLLRLGSTYPTPQGLRSYEVTGLPGGFALMWIAGILSGLLGVGSGAMKVVAMDTLMKIPFKVATTTSNFMIGVTAAASTVIYIQRGFIVPGLCMPVMLGVLIGSLLGAKVLTRVNASVLRRVFSIVALILGLEMIFNGVTGRIS